MENTNDEWFKIDGGTEREWKLYFYFYRQKKSPGFPSRHPIQLCVHFVACSHSQRHNASSEHAALLAKPKGVAMILTFSSLLPSNLSFRAHSGYLQWNHLQCKYSKLILLTRAGYIYSQYLEEWSENVKMNYNITLREINNGSPLQSIMQSYRALLTTKSGSRTMSPLPWWRKA